MVFSVCVCECPTLIKRGRREERGAPLLPRGGRGGSRLGCCRKTPTPKLSTLFPPPVSPLFPPPLTHQNAPPHRVRLRLQGPARAGGLARVVRDGYETRGGGPTLRRAAERPLPLLRPPFPAARGTLARGAAMRRRRDRGARRGAQRAGRGRLAGPGPPAALLTPPSPPLLLPSLPPPPSSVIDGLKYAKSHEWAKVDGDTATVGITDFAQVRRKERWGAASDTGRARAGRTA